MTPEEKRKVLELKEPIQVTICEKIDESWKIMPWLKSNLKKHVCAFFENGEELTLQDEELLRRLFSSNFEQIFVR